MENFREYILLFKNFLTIQKECDSPIDFLHSPVESDKLFFLKSGLEVYEFMVEYKLFYSEEKTIESKLYSSIIELLETQYNSNFVLNLLEENILFDGMYLDGESFIEELDSYILKNS